MHKIHGGLKMTNQEEKGNRKKRLAHGIEIIADEAVSAATEAWSGAASIGESLKDRLQEALSARENVVMVRLNAESLLRLDDLVEAAIVNSRSEAAAFLIGEGIKTRSNLFGRISEKTDEIRRVKRALHDLLEGDRVESETDNEGKAP
jgi:hypothetical protein